MESLRIFGRYEDANEQLALLEKFYSALPPDEPIHFARYSEKASLELAERKFPEAEQDVRQMSEACGRMAGAGSSICGAVDLLLAQIHHAKGDSVQAKADIAQIIARETAKGKPTWR